jgi:hypothetical protein
MKIVNVIDILVHLWVNFCHQRQGKRHGRGKAAIMEDYAKNQREVMGQRLLHGNDAILFFERT